MTRTGTPMFSCVLSTSVIKVPVIFLSYCLFTYTYIESKSTSTRDFSLFRFIPHIYPYSNPPTSLNLFHQSLPTRLLNWKFVSGLTCLLLPDTFLVRSLSPLLSCKELCPCTNRTKNLRSFDHTDLFSLVPLLTSCGLHTIHWFRSSTSRWHLVLYGDPLKPTLSLY